MTAATAPKTRGATAGFRPWTAEDDEAIRGGFAHGRGRALAERLGRTISAIHHRAQRLGIVADRRWTPADDAELRMLWFEVGVAEIAKRMKRTRAAVVQRAREYLGLPLGAPPGLEYVSHAAVRTGFALATLQMILRWAGVKPRPSMSYDRGAKRHFHIVDSVDVDDAIERWLATESLEAAARRIGWSAETLARRLLASGLDVPPRPTRKRHWRIPTVFVDQVVAERAKIATLSVAAKRLGIPVGTLRHRMVKAGVPRPPGKHWLVNPDDVASFARAA
jgi:hypothetical protein